MYVSNYFIPLDIASLWHNRRNYYYYDINKPIFICTGFVQKELVTDLLKECVKMYEFDHPNVLKLSGVCLDGGPAPYIIMPYMENGSLLAHLKEERQSFVLAPENTDPEEMVSTGIV